MKASRRLKEKMTCHYCDMDTGTAQGMSRKLLEKEPYAVHDIMVELSFARRVRETESGSTGSAAFSMISPPTTKA